MKRLVMCRIALRRGGQYKTVQRAVRRVRLVEVKPLPVTPPQPRPVAHEAPKATLEPAQLPYKARPLPAKQGKEKKQIVG